LGEHGEPESSAKGRFYKIVKRDHERKKKKSIAYKIRQLDASIDDWRIYHLRGIIGIVFGIILLAWPEESLRFLVLVIAIQALLKGAIGLGHAISLARKDDKWVMVLLEGAVGLLFGVLLFAWPEATLKVAAVLIGLWMIVTGLGKIVIAFEDRSMVHRGLIGAGGLLSIVIGLVLVILPIESIHLAHTLSAIQALTLGIILIALGFYTMWQAHKAQAEENGSGEEGSGFES
jgi:uncharacterized membrane protein HdeD (DUF308 family)